jgi:hypothetical protein
VDYQNTKVKNRIRHALTAALVRVETITILGSTAGTGASPTVNMEFDIAVAEHTEPEILTHDERVLDIIGLPKSRLNRQFCERAKLASVAVNVTLFMSQN